MAQNQMYHLTFLYITSHSHLSGHLAQMSHQSWEYKLHTEKQLSVFIPYISGTNFQGHAFLLQTSDLFKQS